MFSGDRAVILADVVNGIGFVIIFIVLLESTLAWHMQERNGDNDLAELFGNVSVVTIPTIYVSLNIVVALAAIGQ